MALLSPPRKTRGRDEIADDVGSRRRDEAWLPEATANGETTRTCPDRDVLVNRTCHVREALPPWTGMKNGHAGIETMYTVSLEASCE